MLPLRRPGFSARYAARLLPTRAWVPLTYALLLVLLVPRPAFAYFFNEHEVIGNAAMQRLASAHTTRMSAFWRLLPMTYDTRSAAYAFPQLSRYQSSIGYGTLNALSGDHSVSPLALQEQLLTPNSRILRVVALQRQFAAAHFASAPDGQLAKLDPEYVKLAIRNQSHFYLYGKGASAHLAAFDPADVDRLLDPATVQAVLYRLHGTNALNAYVTIHAAAIRLAEMAGRESDEATAKQWLYYAFLYNSFADHFLQDAFSAGHLLVKRTMFSMLVNNKALHDFYSRHGTRVVNANGEIWTAFGDEAFNQPHDGYLSNRSLRDVSYPTLTPEAERVVNAVTASLTDLADAFDRGRTALGQPGARVVEVPSEPTPRAAHVFRTFRALSHVPLPYGTNLKDLLVDSVSRRPEVQRANQRPYLRDFVRSRVANGMVLGVTTNVGIRSAEYFQGLDLRLNVGLLTSTYRFNAAGTKRGVLDAWHGYTASYTTGDIVSPRDTANGWTMKVGLRSNFDYWVSDERFAGLFTYTEIGMDHRGERSAFIFAPQAGAQLGSLLKVNYYRMPAWARIPAQLLLPLKFKAGTVIAAGRRPAPFSGVEIDLLF